MDITDFVNLPSHISLNQQTRGLVFRNQRAVAQIKLGIGPFLFSGPRASRDISFQVGSNLALPFRGKAYQACSSRRTVTSDTHGTARCKMVGTPIWNFAPLIGLIGPISDPTSKKMSLEALPQKAGM